MTKFLVVLAAAAALSASTFGDVDQLILSGRLIQAEDILLNMAEDGSQPLELVVYRLVGIYHGTGREDQCLLMLDSLQQVLGEDLTGWKVSVLDLAKRTDEALDLVPDEQVLLYWWLKRGSEEGPSTGVLPAPVTPAERAVRVMLCQPGRMNKGQIDLTVLDIAMLPFLEDHLLDQMELLLPTEGEWWDRTMLQLAGTIHSERFHHLMAKRLSMLSTADVEDWEYYLGVNGPASIIAAGELAELDPPANGSSWELTDVLVAGGMIEEAELLASRSGDPWFGIGVSMAVLRQRGRYTELLQLCDSLPEEAPGSLRARAALYLARAQRALQMSPEIYYASYHDFAMQFPNHSKASEAAYLAGKYYSSARNWPAAADAYMTALSTGDFGSARAHWRGGFCHYMCGRGAVGDSIWASGIERYPFSAWCDEMLFWRARYAGKTGRPELQRQLLQETAQRHPREFYGILAGRRLGSEPDLPAFNPVCLTDDELTAEAVNMVASGYGTMASEMLYTSEACEPGRRAAALVLMGEYRRSLALLRSYDYRLRLENRGVLPDSLIRWYFPAPYRRLTENTVSGMGISAALVTGLMRQESHFNRWARSWVGASGLIQLMPGTAGDIARWYDLPALSGDDFYKPDKSILYGSLYLARQYSAFDGALVLTLAAYNAGPGNAAKWMEEFPLEDGDPELFIEQIPLTETRGYVKHVMANAWIYGEIFH